MMSEMTAGTISVCNRQENQQQHTVHGEFLCGRMELAHTLMADTVAPIVSEA
jgi:hypothetical protein